MWPQVRENLSLVPRRTGTFIYALSADETSPVFADPCHTIKSLFACCFKCICHSRWQPHFRSNADRAYNTLHVASKGVCQLGRCPLWKPSQEKAICSPSTGTHIAFSYYPALRLHLSSKSKRGCSAVSLIAGNSTLPFGNCLKHHTYLKKHKLLNISKKLLASRK